MDEIKKNINNIVPFLGAGVSMPYGYPLWSELLLKVLIDIQPVNCMPETTYQEIMELINKGHYMRATEEMYKYWSSLEDFVCQEIFAINPSNNSCLEKYIHLFPSHLYLTTNYDDVVENILRQHPPYKLNDIIATSPITPNTGLKSKEPTLYYLHGKYTNPNSIIFSNSDYNYFYGPERTTNIKAVRRQFLARKLQEIYTTSPLLFIGCSMNMEEDRILKLLKKFNAMGHLPNDFSYALLNAEDLTKEQMDFKKNELLSIRTHPIWYFADKINHEQAKAELFQYILSKEREEYESWQKNKQKEIKEELKKQEEEKEEFKKLKKEIEEFSEIIKTFPYPQKYYSIGCNYEFVLIKINNKHYLSDQGKTFKMLDKVFELKEPDVLRNLVFIARECAVQIIENELLVTSLESWNDLPDDQQQQLLEEAKCRLFSCVSFMDKMRIFYV